MATAAISAPVAGGQDVVVPAKWQAVGCLQMFKKHPNPKQLREMLDLGLGVAASLKFHAESEYHAACGWIHYNCLGPNWDQWCHPQDQLSTADIEYWERRFEEAELFFRRGDGNMNKHAAQIMRVTRLRNLIKGPEGGGRKADWLESELEKEYSGLDRVSRGYYLVIQSHRAARHDQVSSAIDQLLEAESLYASALGNDHRFTAECRLRLAQLGYGTASPFEAVQVIHRAKVPNSQHCGYAHGGPDSCHGRE